MILYPTHHVQNKKNNSQKDYTINNTPTNKHNFFFEYKGMNLKIFCPFQYLDFQYHSYITSNQIHNSKSTICKNFEFNAKR